MSDCPSHTPPRATSRPAPGRLVVGGVLSVAAGVASLVLACLVVFSMTLGPVALSVSRGPGRGVHTGDLLAVPIVAFGLACLALGRWLLGRARAAAT